MHTSESQVHFGSPLFAPTNFGGPSGVHGKPATLRELRIIGDTESVIDV